MNCRRISVPDTPAKINTASLAFLRHFYFDSWYDWTGSHRRSVTRPPSGKFCPVPLFRCQNVAINYFQSNRAHFLWIYCKLRLVARVKHKYETIKFVANNESIPHPGTFTTPKIKIKKRKASGLETQTTGHKWFGVVVTWRDKKPKLLFFCW